MCRRLPVEGAELAIVKTAQVQAAITDLVNTARAANTVRKEKPNVWIGCGKRTKNASSSSFANFAWRGVPPTVPRLSSLFASASSSSDAGSRSGSAAESNRGIYIGCFSLDDALESLIVTDNCKTGSLQRRTSIDVCAVKASMSRAILKIKEDEDGALKPMFGLASRNVCAGDDAAGSGPSNSNSSNCSGSSSSGSSTGGNDGCGCAPERADGKAYCYVLDRNTVFSKMKRVDDKECDTFDYFQRRLGLDPQSLGPSATPSA